MTVPFWLGVAAAAVAAGSILDAVVRRRREGAFLGIGYDWLRPTVARVRDRVWNPADRRVFVPKAFGWGWTVNLARVWQLVRRAAGRSG